MHERMITENELERALRYFLCNCMEELMKYVIQDSWYLGCNLNMGPPNYVARVLSTTFVQTTDIKLRIVALNPKYHLCRETHTVRGSTD
jgi:hypothetical protein